MSLALLNALPPQWPEDVRPAVRRQLAADRRKVVVLDDDPTGTQTVHGVPVLTEWPVSALQAELQNDLPAFYLLTNSRSLPPAQAQALNGEVGRNLRMATAQGERDFTIISRSDSTLRGHFPGEVEALAEGLGRRFDAWLLAPFFLEGGRYTIGDVHYVADVGTLGDRLTPVGETEFARDAAFGFRSSNLRDWVEEKTAGRLRAAMVASISIEDIRRGGPEVVSARLLALPASSVCVINAASQRDAETFTAGLLMAEAQGRRYLFRTAASFVPVRAGLEPRPPLSRAELLPNDSAAGALIVAGSYIPKTTQQLEALFQQAAVERVELNVPALLSDPQAAIETAARAVEAALRAGRDVVAYTSRALIAGHGGEASLEIGRRISHSLVQLVRAIRVRPRYLLAKGGITSSDLAVRGLGVKRALVLGQIIPGVPAWRLGSESRWPGLRYIVFPGNVGGPGALADVVAQLSATLPARA